MTDQERFMKEAIRQAKKARALEEVPIGCVIVHEGKIIARGYNRRNTDKNTLSHAELNAIRKASKKLGDWRLEGCTMYVTLEPCQMCSGALVQSRIDEVVIGCMNPKAGCAGSVMNLLQIEGFNHQVKITEGVLEEECSEMLSTFFKELREKKKQAKMLGVYVYHRDRGDSTMNDNKSRRVGNIFPVLQDACRFYREKELMDTYGKELEYFCTRILLCSSMGRISRVRDRKLRKSLREETFVFLRENFPEYRKNPYLGNGLKGRYLRIATPALCGICGGNIGRCRPGGLPG